jgi:hypothetical protein
MMTKRQSRLIISIETAVEESVQAVFVRVVVRPAEEMLELDGSRRYQGHLGDRSGIDYVHLVIRVTTNIVRYTDSRDCGLSVMFGYLMFINTEVGGGRR